MPRRWHNNKGQNAAQLFSIEHSRSKDRQTDREIETNTVAKGNRGACGTISIRTTLSQRWRLQTTPTNLIYITTTLTTTTISTSTNRHNRYDNVNIQQAFKQRRTRVVARGSRDILVTKSKTKINNI